MRTFWNFTNNILNIGNRLDYIIYSFCFFINIFIINNNTKNQPNGNIGDQNKGKGKQGAEKQNQKNEPQNPNDPNKIPKDLQKLILQRSANQERETAKKLLNKNGYYSPESNTKDW